MFGHVQWRLLGTIRKIDCEKRLRRLLHKVVMKNLGGCDYARVMNIVN